MQKLWDNSFYLVAAIVIAVLMYYLKPVLTPFLVGALLAYLGDPLVVRLMRFRIPRLAAVILVFVILFLVLVLIILLLIPIIQKQIATLIIVLPNILNWLQTNLAPLFNEYLGYDLNFDANSIKEALNGNWTKAGSAVKLILEMVVISGFTVLAWITDLVLTPVVTFYLLRDWNAFLTGIKNLFPKRMQITVVKLAKQCDDVLSAFLRGQLLVMISLGILYSIGLSAVGLQLGVMIGLLAGLLSIIPYLGFIVGILAASIAAYVQFGTLLHVLLVLGVFAIGQTLETAVLTPTLVGDKIGLHPVAVIFALLAGGALCGFFGILLALPVAAVVMVMIRFFNQQYRNSQLYR